MTGGSRRPSGRGACRPGSAVTRSVAPSWPASVCDSQVSRPIARGKPCRVCSRFDPCRVVTIGVLRGSRRRVSRSQWSPCRWESTTASTGASSSGVHAGSVSRREDSPCPR